MKWTGVTDVFERGYFLDKTATVRQYAIPLRGESVAAKFIAPSFDGSLKFKRDFHLWKFDRKVWVNFFQKCSGLKAGNAPNMLRPVESVPLAVVIAVTPPSVLSVQTLDDGKVRNGNVDVKLHPAMDGACLISGYPNHTLTVEQTSNVTSIKSFHRASDEKLANSVDIRCPARKGAEGQYRTKQGETLGVRREQVPTPKGKICSDLHRNMQRLAEMTGLLCVFVARHIRVMITECNTNYLQFRPYRERNFVPLGDERMSTNQDAVVRLLGWAGNMTCRGPQFSGVAIE